MIKRISVTIKESTAKRLDAHLEIQVPRISRSSFVETAISKYLQEENFEQENKTSSKKETKSRKEVN